MNNVRINVREAEEIIDGPPESFLYKGTFIVFLILIVTLIISAIIHYPDSVNASATISAKQPSYNITAHCSGIIDTILVSEGEYIHAGQPAVLLRNTLSYSDYVMVKNTVSILENPESSLSHKQIRDIINCDFGGEIRKSFEVFFSIYDQYEVFLNDQSVSLEIQERHMAAEEINKTLALKNSHKKLKAGEADLSYARLRKDSILFEKGVISENEWNISKSEFLKIKQQHYALLEELSILGKESAAMTIKAKILKEKKDSERRLYLARIQAAVKELSSSLEKWERKNLLVAGIAGEIVLRKDLYPGKYYEQGEHLASVIPAGNTNNIVTLSVPEMGRGKIHEGQTIIITLAAYPSIEFGTITTSVEYISAVPVNGQYLVCSTLPDTIKTSFKKTIFSQSELQGTAEIITNSQSILQRVVNLIHLKKTNY